MVCVDLYVSAGGVFFLVCVCVCVCVRQYVGVLCVFINARRYKSWSYNNSFPIEPCLMPPLKNVLPMCSSASSLQIGKQYICH